VKTNTTIIVTALDPTMATYSGKVTTKLAKEAQGQGLKGGEEMPPGSSGGGLLPG
jgi:hypothetical protein